MAKVLKLAANLLSAWFGIPTAVSTLPAVASLFTSSGPSTVLWRVRAIVVNPIDRMLGRRPRPHIGKERLEAVDPAITHRDAARAVLLEVRRRRIEAAIFQALPRVVLDRAAQPVRAVRLPDSFKPIAAAGLALFAKVILSNDRNRSAVASARPCPVAWRRTRGLMAHNKAAESLACKVWSLWHFSILQLNGALVGDSNGNF